jgi:hypothetical protein
MPKPKQAKVAKPSDLALLWWQADLCNEQWDEADEQRPSKIYQFKAPPQKRCGRG